MFFRFRVVFAMAMLMFGWQPMAQTFFWMTPSTEQDLLQLKQELAQRGLVVRELAPEGRLLVEGSADAAASLPGLKKIEALKSDSSREPATTARGMGERPPTTAEQSLADVQLTTLKELTVNKLAKSRAKLDGGGTLPSAVDNSVSQYFPPIRSQGSTGSCTAWASGYYYETFTQAADEGLNPASGDNTLITSPAFVYPLINYGVDAGSSMDLAMACLRDAGCCSWALKPYQDSDWISWPSEAAWTDALSRRTRTVHMIGSYSGCTDDDITAIKTHLANGYVAGTRTSVYSNWYLNYPSTTTGIDNAVLFASSGTLEGGHALTIVGYDDNRTYNDNGTTKQGAFLLANSWGSWWGTTNTAARKGFMWVAYEYFKANNNCFGMAFYNDDRPQYRSRLYVASGLNHAGRSAVTYGGGIGLPGSAVWQAPALLGYAAGSTSLPVDDSKRVVIDLNDGVARISDYSHVRLYSSMQLNAATTQTGTITSAQFYHDFDGDGLFQVVSSTDPTVTVNPNAIGYAKVDFQLDQLQISPTSAFVTSGLEAGPFTPATANYTLSNPDSTAIQWSAATTVGWASVTPSSGTLAGSGSLPLTITLTSQANALPAGSYTGQLRLTNLQSSVTQAREINLGIVGASPGTFYCNPLNADPGWTCEGFWAFGVPQGLGGNGSLDPQSGYTGSNVYGYNLSGNYQNNMTTTRSLTSTAIDCRGQHNIKLQFWRWLGVESALYDYAQVSVSTDGTHWTRVWQNTADLLEQTWTWCEYDISAVADDQPTVYLRWSMGTTDSSGTYCGWNIDDIALNGTPFPSVQSLTSVTSDGAWCAGTAIDVALLFNRAVTVSGTPQLTLETGATDAVVNYTSGSGTTTLHFLYTVASGHENPDLDVVSTGALTLNGGSIMDAADGVTAALLPLPAPGAAGSLSFNKNLNINTSLPTVSGAVGLAGDAVKVFFSEPMSNLALDPANYALSGAGRGSCAAQPDSVTALDSATYRLNWSSGTMLEGQSITITASDAMTDDAGNLLGTPKSASLTAVPAELSHFSAE
jgi:C1A family cysteine protease